MTWTVVQTATGWNWTAQVADDTAEGDTATEPDALREVAWALDWLQGGVNLSGMDRTSCATRARRN